MLRLTGPSARKHVYRHKLMLHKAARMWQPLTEDRAKLSLPLDSQLDPHHHQHKAVSASKLDPEAEGSLTPMQPLLL